MKKQLLITTHTLNIGGVERSFIGLLENIDTSQYDVDVFVYNHDGELLSAVPENVHLLPENKHYAALLKPLGEVLRTRCWGVALSKLLARIVSFLHPYCYKTYEGKVNSYGHFYLYYIANIFLPKISKKKYDAVLAFLHPNIFEKNKLIAQRYYAWIHTDFSFLNINKKLEFNQWDKFDAIFGVSAANVAGFVSVFPELQEKTGVLENILSPKFIKTQASLFDVDTEMTKNNDEVIFLSIGRYSVQKNFDNIPFIAQRLKELGLRFKWYIIGFGSETEEKKITDAIMTCNMMSNVILLGKKASPYPYIQHCDYYIQPSVFEGKSVAVREAQILGKIPIITNYSSAYSQVENNYDGVILPLDNNEFAEGLFALLQDKEKIKYLYQNIIQSDYSNVGELNKLYAALST